MEWVCAWCGDVHDDLPFAYAPGPPAGWDDAADHPASELTDELCVMRGEQFYVRGVVRLPVRDADDDFEWGVWVSLSHESFARTLDTWERPGRESAQPMFGWLCTALPLYEPATVGLKTNVHLQPVGLRPDVQVEPTRHPLALEQRTGITLARVREIAAYLLHE